MPPIAAALLYFFGLAVAAPQGIRLESKTVPGELVLRLAVHVQKTPDGARLVFNVEETPETSTDAIRPSSSAKPLLSFGTEFPLQQAPEELRASAPVRRTIQNEPPEQFFASDVRAYSRRKEANPLPVQYKHEGSTTYKEKLKLPADGITTDLTGLSVEKAVGEPSDTRLGSSDVSINFKPALPEENTQKQFLTYFPTNRSTIRQESVPQKLQFQISLGGMSPMKVEQREIIASSSKPTENSRDRLQNSPNVFFRPITESIPSAISVGYNSNKEPPLSSEIQKNSSEDYFRPAIMTDRPYVAPEKHHPEAVHQSGPLFKPSAVGSTPSSEPPKIIEHDTRGPSMAGRPFPVQVEFSPTAKPLSTVKLETYSGPSVAIRPFPIQVGLGSKKTLRSTTPQPLYISEGVSNIVPTGEDDKVSGEDSSLSSTIEDTEEDDSTVNKAAADQGFGVLTSRCASFAPGLVPDGAGGCTKPANRVRKKHFPIAYKSVGANEIQSDVKEVADSDAADDAMEVINLHNL